MWIPKGAAIIRDLGLIKGNTVDPSFKYSILNFQKIPVKDSIFGKVSGLQPAILLKHELFHRYLYFVTLWKHY